MSARDELFEEFFPWVRYVGPEQRAAIRAEWEYQEVVRSTLESGAMICDFRVLHVVRTSPFRIETRLD